MGEAGSGKSREGARESSKADSDHSVGDSVKTDDGSDTREPRGGDVGGDSDGGRW